MAAWAQGLRCFIRAPRVHWACTVASPAHKLAGW